MLATFIILFREFLEISIILSLILAATRGVAGRGRWVLLGIGGGLTGAALVAVFADRIAEALEGAGQEVFNAGVLLVAVAMIIWTVVWMKTHARALVHKIHAVGKAVSEGERPLYSVAVIVALSMWREGAEIVLFMTGLLSTSQEPASSVLLGGAAGMALAGAIGAALYLGLITLSMKHLFSVTGWLLALLACGMSAQAAGYLAQAGFIPELISPLWDSGWLLAQDSLPGRILHALLGYTERPSAMQLLWYLGTLALILGLLRHTRGPGQAVNENGGVKISSPRRGEVGRGA